MSKKNNFELEMHKTSLQKGLRLTHHGGSTHH